MAWREAQIVRDYIEAVRERGVADESWIQWASARVEETEPGPSDKRSVRDVTLL